MKKLLTSIAFLSIVFYANAQELEFGIKAGINTGKGSVSEIKSWSNDPQTFNSLNGGVYGRLKVMLVGLYVQPEVVLNSRSGVYKFSDATNGSISFEATNKALYVDVPVLLGLKMLKLFRVYAGPNFQFLVNQETTFSNISGGVLPTKKDLNKQNTGVQIGVGLDLWKLRLDGKWDWNPGSMGNFMEYNNNAPTLKNSMFTVQLGFKLWGIL
ncbi:MAG: outer membrane beta-barrel protein [Bacteroidota bacterium]|nr:outer membrane beta-barrel protein [Bacteroidota bacterium]